MRAGAVYRISDAMYSNFFCKLFTYVVLEEQIFEKRSCYFSTRLLVYTNNKQQTISPKKAICNRTIFIYLEPKYQNMSTSDGDIKN